MPEQWCYGGVDFDTGEFFLTLVPDRSVATLLPVIQANVVPGTQVWSDEWAAYRNLNLNGYVHETVNHTQQFVNPATGVHKNNI